MGSVIQDARHSLNAALKEAFKNNSDFMNRVDKYFGTSEGGTDATTHAVMKTINAMKIAVDSDLYHIRKGGVDGNTNASMQTVPQQNVGFTGDRKENAKRARLQGTYVYVGKPINILEAMMLRSSRNGSAEMMIYQQFFEMKYKLGDQQSQIQTFLHELSHCAGGTHDVDDPKCYGWQGVLYCKQNGTASKNAENYGMFLQSFLI